MSFEWREYLALAQELFQEGRTAPGHEAKLRSAVSRAYYAAFGAARNVLRDQRGVHISASGRAHREVWQWFEDSGFQEIGQEGKRLREERRKADYQDIIIENLPDLTQKALKASQKILSKLSAAS